MLSWLSILRLSGSALNHDSDQVERGAVLAGGIAIRVLI